MSFKILGRTVLGLLSVAIVLSSPMLGLLGLAAWQQYDPGSFRATVHEVSAMTDVGSADTMFDNLAARLDGSVLPRG